MRVRQFRHDREILQPHTNSHTYLNANSAAKPRRPMWKAILNAEVLSAACVSTRRSTADCTHVKIGLECAQVIERFGRGISSYRLLVRQIGRAARPNHPRIFAFLSLDTFRISADSPLIQERAYRRIFLCGATSRCSLPGAFLGTADSVTPGISISSKRSCTSVAGTR
jgi:hypothetical protein